MNDFACRQAFVTGAAGFIGSNMVDRLLAEGVRVVGYDNLSTGFEEFLASAGTHPKFTFVRGDLLDGATLASAMDGADIVFHFAANADVRFGLAHPRKDLELNTVATFNVLEAMRQNEVKRIVFSSTGSIYGEARVIPTPEDAPFPVQTSLYGASKLACEGMIEAYAEGFGLKAYIFRFVSILGPRYTHGHIFDFYKKLLGDPTRLEVLGNGRQRKSYLHVDDCIDGILHALGVVAEKVNRYNLGAQEYCHVDDSIGWIMKCLELSPVLEYTGGARGWVGDNPFIFLDTSRMRDLGWRPRHSIRDGVIETLQWLADNRWVLERRA